MALPADHHVDLEVELEHVTARLQKRFDQRVDPRIVEATVRRSAAEFRAARVVDFVPVLIERHSAAVLE
jgi:hypothetical protein